MLTYKEIYFRDPKKDPDWARKSIYQYSLNHSISKTAENFGCHINTVKKIIRNGRNGIFHNASRAPNSSPNKLSQNIIDAIYKAREDKGMGHHNLKHQYDIPASSSSIYRYLLKRPDTIKPRRKKWKITKDFKKIKQKYKAFEHLQVDGKVLYDIPQFYGFYKKFNIPKLQFTITCQKTGASFISYADGETSLEACTFIIYFLEHLKKFGIDTKNITFKTDRGSYATGSLRSFKKSAFTSLIQSVYNAKHRLNKHKNQNADVERFHGLVEEYFYKQTSISSLKNFFVKAADSQLWFNFIRKNGGKNWKTPIQILKEDYPDINPEVLALPPIYLNKCSDLYFYKTDPNYQPFSKKIFSIDMSPSKKERFHSTYRKDDFSYFLGKASNSCFLNNFKEVSHV